MQDGCILLRPLTHVMLFNPSGRRHCLHFLERETEARLLHTFHWAGGRTGFLPFTGQLAGVRAVPHGHKQEHGWDRTPPLAEPIPMSWICVLAHYWTLHISEAERCYKCKWKAEQTPLAPLPAHLSTPNTFPQAHATSPFPQAREPALQHRSYPSFTHAHLPVFPIRLSSYGQGPKMTSQWPKISLVSKWAIQSAFSSKQMIHLIHLKEAMSRT